MKKVIWLILMLLSCVSLMSQPAAADPYSVEVAIGADAAEGTYTGAITPYSPFVNAPKSGTLGVFISGTFVATVGLQYSIDRGVTWEDLYINGVRKTYTTKAHDTITDFEPGILYRIGVAAGEFTSGTVNVRLSK